MFEFTLLKSLFFEMDPNKMDGVTETKKEKSTFRTISISYDRVPEITSITAEERILPYVDRYYFYINGEQTTSDPKEMPAKQAIYEFYKDRFPTYLKDNLPEDMTDYPILDAFEVFRMPDYRPKHAFPGLITLDDLRSGNVPKDTRAFTFPGLELLGGRSQAEGEEEKPAIADYEGYTSFGGDREKAAQKIEEMKKQFAIKQ